MLVERILAHGLEQAGKEGGVVLHLVEVEVELEEHAGGDADVALVPVVACIEMVEVHTGRTPAGGAHALLMLVDVGEHVVAGLGGTDDVDDVLVVVADFMAGSPDGATLVAFSLMGQAVVVHHGGQGVLVVIGTVGGGEHVVVGHAEAVPDIVVAAFQFVQTHVALLVGEDGVPHTHQTLHLVGLALLHHLRVHAEHQMVVLQVQHGAFLQQVLLQQFPVGVGHATGGIPVAVQASAFDVDLNVGIVGQILLGIVQLIEDVQVGLVAQQDGVESGMQRGLSARAAGAGHGLHSQRTVCAGLSIHKDVDDVACIARDTRGVGQTAKPVAHARILHVGHQLIVAVHLVVGHAEEALVVGRVAGLFIGKLLPGVVLHLQHHGLKRGREGCIVGIGGQFLIAEGLHLVLQHRACGIREEGLHMGGVGLQIAAQFKIVHVVLLGCHNLLVGQFHGFVV